MKKILLSLGKIGGEEKEKQSLEERGLGERGENKEKEIKRKVRDEKQDTG